MSTEPTFLPFDNSILNENALPPPQFLIEVLGPAADWVLATAKQTSTSPDYAACALLTGASAAIGNTRWTQPRPGWREPPHLWIGLVGKSASRKSSALNAVVSLLRETEQAYVKDHEEELRMWETEEAAAKEAEATWLKQVKAANKEGAEPPIKPDSAVCPPMPTRRRFVVSDTTTEAVGAILANEHRGVWIVRDELAGWISSFDAYKSGSGGDRAFWLEANGGRPFTIDRVKNGGLPLVIPYLSCAVSGTIQPDRLQPILNSINDGFAARLLWTWPKRVRPNDSLQEIDYSATDAFQWLTRLEMVSDDKGAAQPLCVPFTEAARAKIHELENTIFDLTQNEGGAFESHLGKYSGFAIRLALTLQYLEAAFGNKLEPREIGLRAVENACDLLLAYFEPMARRCFASAAQPEDRRLAASIARTIVESQSEIRANGYQINKRNLHRAHFRAYDAKTIGAALDHLEQAGWICPANCQQESGRPRADWHVNHEIFLPTLISQTSGQKGQLGL